ncbi:protein SCO1/2 [Pedobacter steynii]|uniref:Protein SCO1/2 n=1 Tax=Pedobacter steynii TaxID=430522 RepID=A0A1H0BI29_9SPHI|nr:SCO family protein [Pedobacter steynii]NQX41048.1 SCO family protein [Pedobacter steynii]SDN45282.1 protein SCO1/2 [Pedobacter steynii]
MKLNFSLPLSFLFALAIFVSSCQNNKKLPILGPREAVSVKNEDGSMGVDTVYQTIPAFRFLNQDSVYITNDQFKDKIYIADFFFTSCTTICPTMHRNMKTIFEKYKDNPEVMYLSHTIDFKYDKPSVLKKYAEKLGVDGNKWQFVYGSKDSVYQLAERNYLVAVMEDTTARDGYIHQGWLVLIDKQKRIRGAYDGTDPKQVEQLTKDIPVLLAEDKK